MWVVYVLCTTPLCLTGAPNTQVAGAHSLSVSKERIRLTSVASSKTNFYRGSTGTPSGVAVKNHSILPNSPYKDASQAIMFVWRPARWANWMFEIEAKPSLCITL